MEIISQLRLRGISVENNREDSTEFLEIKTTYVLKEEMRSGPLTSQTISLTDDDILEFQFDDDTVWISDPGSMDEMFPDAIVSLKNRGSSVFELPSTMSVQAEQRGLFKDVALKVFKVFTKKKVAGPLVGFLAKELEDKILQTARGVLKVSRSFDLTKATDLQSGLHLLMIHGTAASTHKTFGEMRLENERDSKETALWQTIFTQYDKNVLAFEHESLTKSPLDNVLDLVKELPNNMSLHLLTQSRGGLVGEMLNKFCDEKSDGKGFSEAEKKYLRDHGREEDADKIEEIEKAIADKNIRVEKFIRVACPANGTTLASKRLDVWLNVIFNVAGLALAQPANPVYIAFKNLLISVVETKDDPNVLPGLAPQNPESALNKVLNNGETQLELSTPLLIIAGDNQLSFKFKALLGILTNLFFLGKNDFVVNTRSMYQGARRAKGIAQFFQDESSEVSHFNYFKNPSTRGAILRALQSVGSASIQGFSPVPENVLEPASLRGISLTLSKGELRPKKVSGNRPIAIIVPGIMGSNLYDKDDLVWVNFAGFFAGNLSRLEHSNVNNKNITALSLVGDSYAKLYQHLSSEYDVTVFPFDWRLSMKSNTDLFKDLIEDLMNRKQPIKLIGHSMGGVLIRDFMIDHPVTWKDLNNKPDFSLLFLGAPLNGSFRIAYVLFGRDSLIKKLGLIDTKNSKKELLQFFTQFPGILGLLPFTIDAANDFGNTGTWEKMRKADGDEQWPIPDPQLLKDFTEYRTRILEGTPSLDFSKAIYVAGLADGKAGTISGYQIVSKSFFLRERVKLEFKATLEGDGSVTWESGIPKKLIQSEKVYYSDVEHGELANDERLFAGISDILKVGSTKKIPKTRPMFTRGIGTEFVAPESFDFDTSEAGLKSAILGLRSPESELIIADLPIDVTVAHGNLKYASYPLLIGHFENDGILSAEKAVDEHLKNELSRRLKLGLYPGEIGTNMRVLTDGSTNFKGAIVLGLGKQGVLNDRYLVTTIEQGVANYLINLIEKNESKLVEDHKAGLSALIIGSGYGGLGVESCVRAILEGVQNANQKIREAYAQKAFRVHELEFIELYQDNSLACMKALKVLESAEGTGLSIQRNASGIIEKLGRRQRIPMESTVEWWTRIMVKRLDNENNNLGKKHIGLQFSITTDAARIEERILLTTGKEITKLVEAASVNGQWTPELAKTLFELLIPNDFKSTLKQLSNMILQLDDFTASFPWELLQDSIDSACPISINSGVIRQLATPNFRMLVSSVTTNTALVIADPDLENPKMQLAAALLEGSMVSKVLTEKGYGVISENGATVDRILIKLYSQNYKILHLAGHGVFEFGEEKQTGMLIGKDIFLTPAHIDQMSSVPELVFVNCCFLGQTEARSEELSQHRNQLAANLGTQLIRIGVKAVVVAGWAVNDNAALYFAEIFYQAMLEGRMFGEAVKKARKAVFETSKNRSNTWGAYQCYGDPFYRLTTWDKQGTYVYDFEIPALAEMELNNLKNELDTGSDTNQVLQKLNAIILALKKDNLSNAKITELLALIYTSLGMYEEAIAHFKKLGTISKAEFSLAALEQHCNIRVKYSMQEVKVGRKSASDTIPEIRAVLRDIDILLAFGKTDERFNIQGSSFKRLGKLSSGPEKLEAYQKAWQAYDTACSMTSAKNKYYPLTNSVLIRHALILIGPTKNTKPKPVDAVKETKEIKETIFTLKEQVQTELTARLVKSLNDPNYWDFVAEADLTLCKHLLTFTKKGFEEVFALYTKVWKDAGHQGNRLSTLEHLEILIDLYGLSEAGKEITAALQELKSRLEGLGWV